MWRNSKSLVVKIDDEGNGFEEQRGPDPREDENLELGSGRGLLIARAFVDELESSNCRAQGTQVRILKHLRLAQKREDNRKRRIIQ